MLFDRATSKLKFDGVRALPVLCAMAVALAFAPMTAPAAHATDLGYLQASEASHFVRIGLGKSVVIRLPADAKDVIVGDPAIVDAVVRTKNTAYLFARTVGQTNIFFFDAQGRQIMNIDLEVALDMLALQKLINRTSPGTRITVDTVGSNVVLGGTASNAVEAKLAEDMAGKFATDPKFVVNAMKIAGGDQVMLKVRVVEIQRNVLKELGINIDQLAFDVGKFAFNLSSLNPVDPLFGFGGGGKVSGNTGGVDFSSTFRALESNGVLHTLAEPNLSAVSGEAATFHAGGQFPVSTRTCDSNGCTDTVTYKDFGVLLGFTPVVLSEGRISLKIDTEVSDLDFSRVVNGNPNVNTRSASTTIELPSGGSMMLAGLIQNKDQQNLDGTPGLKNLPVLGALFRSRSFQSNETELVVIVTPYIVNPAHEKQLATPSDRFSPATDLQATLFGRLNRLYGTAGQHPDGVYHGNVGFIIE